MGLSYGAFAGEADIKIPPLDAVKFAGLGGISGEMLMYIGIGICAIGAVFGLADESAPRIADVQGLFVGRKRDGENEPRMPFQHAQEEVLREILRLIGAGLPASHIAVQTSLIVKTVSTYRRRVLDKMGMHNNAQLTHYAVKHQLVG